MPSTNRRAGRPRGDHGLITLSMIGHATLAALRTGAPHEGAAKTLSVSQIAGLLGVRSQSLYHHISGVPDAVNAARGVLIADMDLHVLKNGSFRQAAIEFAVEYYKAFHPLAACLGTFFRHRVTDPHTLAMYELFLHRAAEASVPAAQRLPLLLDIEYAVFSMIYEQSALNSMLSLSSTDDQHYPWLAAGLAAHATDSLATDTRLRARVTQLIQTATAEPTHRN
ncbi:hypothetical protein CQ018_17725 [Arthrobacter sp. MYb227]|uniref:hypothetical protein n=1 Tax=Arthrobacter sp. MYb227 TaxID=1848601 RepID=UPI000CFD60C2|nr:hypothetical protein [Arthrobacter sp. MYb227]PQZ87300.1 hypothetical protein CQ018_17725 [Arthrobacter sp. MYb227]